jgi:hypothetical protein
VKQGESGDDSLRHLVTPMPAETMSKFREMSKIIIGVTDDKGNINSLGTSVL